MLDDLDRQATKAQKEGLGDGGGWMEGGGGRDGGRGQRLSLFPRTILTMGISEHYF